MRSLFSTALASALLVAPATALATTVLDPAGDFSPGYTAGAADLDVRSFTVLYNSATQLFTLSAVMNGTIDAATDGFYIIGVDTGTGPNAPFAMLGAPNVRFNQTIRINKDGAASIAGVAVPSATIAGAGFSINLLASLFPSTGFSPERYGFNLWPRGPNAAGLAATLVTDFSPDNATIAAVPVPEPGIWAMLIAGFGLTGVALRRRRAPGSLAAAA